MLPRSHPSSNRTCNTTGHATLGGRFTWHAVSGGWTSCRPYCRTGTCTDGRCPPPLGIVGKPGGGFGMGWGLLSSTCVAWQKTHFVPHGIREEEKTKAHVAVNKCSYQSQWWGWVPAGGYRAEVGYFWTLWLCCFCGETCASSAASFWSETQCGFSYDLMYGRSCHSEGRGKDAHLGKVGEKK